MYRKFIKPSFDRILAVILMVVLAPFLVLVVLIIFIIDGSPVFFIQNRSGIGMKCFRMYKFRTLAPLENSDLSMKNRQFTKTGRSLRKTGIDELPQLLNILKGEMSFVGPRPMPVEYVVKYNDRQRERFEVMPGITGWAQVAGRNQISWSERFKLDIWYVGNQSFLLDVKICLMTMVQIVKLQPEHTMPVFNGSN
ncbi:MAG: sugar transferase [Cyclobacteriaceae bacterium]|nr:sugar transferase [Cyclobacteriaceae bacterium]